MINNSINVEVSRGAPWYLMLQYTVIQPGSVVIGIIGNLWLLWVFLFKEINISKITKFYYIIIGVADLFGCIKNLFWDVLCDSFWIYTNGSIYFCIDIFSQLGCITANMSFFLTEIISNYCLSAL